MKIKKIDSLYSGKKSYIYTPYGWYYKGFTDTKNRHYSFNSLDMVYYRDEDDEMYMLENSDIDDMVMAAGN